MSTNVGNTKIVGRGIVLAANGQGDLQLVFQSSRMNKLYYFDTANINRFALRKPVVLDIAAGPITDEQMAAAHCGLSPRTMTKLLQMSVGYSGSHSTYDADSCLEEAAQWDYTRPNATQYKRVLDFYAYSETGEGYNTLAVPPDAGWSSIELTAENLATMVSITQSISGSGGSFVLDPSNDAFIYQSFSILFGQGSNQRWGDTTNMEIPISFVTALEDLWRLAIAVWIPLGDSGAWHYFIGRQCIKNYTDGRCTMGEIMPDLGTNQVAAYRMREYVVANGYTTFKAIPLLVKDIRYEYVDVSGQKFQPRVVAGATLVYCMASGANSLPISCGTPPEPVYYQIVQTPDGSVVRYFIKNKDDSEHSYRFSYTATIYHNGTATSTTSGTTATLAPGEQQQVVGHANEAGWGADVVVTAQTQV